MTAGVVVVVVVGVVVMVVIGVVVEVVKVVVAVVCVVWVVVSETTNGILLVAANCCAYESLTPYNVRLEHP